MMEQVWILIILADMSMGRKRWFFIRLWELMI